MEAIAWTTLIITGLIIATTALGLIRVILHLYAVQKTLSAVLGGVEAVAANTSTVPTVVPSVNESLQPVRDFCDSV